MSLLSKETVDIDPDHTFTWSGGEYGLQPYLTRSYRQLPTSRQSSCHRVMPSILDQHVSSTYNRSILETLGQARASFAYYVFMLISAHTGHCAPQWKGVPGHRRNSQPNYTARPAETRRSVRVSMSQKHMANTPFLVKNISTSGNWGSQAGELPNKLQRSLMSSTRAY